MATEMSLGTPVTRESQRLCPKDRAKLAVVLSDGAEVDACETCRGVWVDYVEEKDLLRITPAVFTLDELRRLRTVYKPFERRDPVRYVPCPICGELMHRVMWGSHSGVVVDRCDNHGTWYDARELDKVREFVALGGIEYEKYRLAEQGLTNLTSRLTQEISRLDTKIDGAYRRARLYGMLGF